jgi:hypothetical protein
MQKGGGQYSGQFRDTNSGKQKIPGLIRNFTALTRYSMEKIQVQHRHSECNNKNHSGLQKGFKTFVHLYKV